MKHLLIAVVIGVLTIGISIFVLSDSDETYENDAKEDREIVLGESFEGANYIIRPTSFECGEHTSVTEEEDVVEGCVLSVRLTNTTIFEQLLNLDGDLAISGTGAEFTSSDALSRSHIADNGLTQEIAVDETVEGGIFFDVPAGTTIETVQIFENSTSDPIVITL